MGVPEELKFTLHGHTDVHALPLAHEPQPLAYPITMPARIWGVPEELKFTLQGHTDEVLCVAISPDCTMCVSGSRDKTAKCVRELGQLASGLEISAVSVWDRSL